jgi:hypothetical protein
MDHVPAEPPIDQYGPMPEDVEVDLKGQARSPDGDHRFKTLVAMLVVVFALIALALVLL